MAWEEIEDNKVRHIWKRSKDDECIDENDEACVSPDWYECNGTPICSCGMDFVYVRTEIKR